MRKMSFVLPLEQLLEKLNLHVSCWQIINALIKQWEIIKIKQISYQKSLIRKANQLLKCGIIIRDRKLFGAGWRFQICELAQKMYIKCSRVEQNIAIFQNKLISFNLVIEEDKMGKKRTHYKKQEIPFFVTKLLNILDDPNNHQLISWNQTGDHFVIHNEDKLRHQILPQKFRHHNMASFIRQLNLYGFHKLENISEYYHEHFRRDEPEKARLIKRISNNKKKKKINKLYQKQMEEGYEKIYEQLQIQTQKNNKLKQQVSELIEIKKQTRKSLRKLQFYSGQIKQKLEIQSKYVPSSSEVESQRHLQMERIQTLNQQKNNNSRDLRASSKIKQNTSSHEKHESQGQSPNQQINSVQTPRNNSLRARHKTIEEEMQELMNSYFL